MRYILLQIPLNRSAIFTKSRTSADYFSNSTNSFVTNGRFSPFVDCHTLDSTHLNAPPCQMRKKVCSTRPHNPRREPKSACFLGNGRWGEGRCPCCVFVESKFGKWRRGRGSPCSTESCPTKEGHAGLLMRDIPTYMPHVHWARNWIQQLDGAEIEKGNPPSYVARRHSPISRMQFLWPGPAAHDSLSLSLARSLALVFLGDLIVMMFVIY